MKMVIKKLCKTVMLLGCIIIGFNNSLAQNNNGPDETFLGVGSGSRKIARTQKVAINPLQIDSSLEMDKVKYYLEPKQQEVSYEIENITPAKLKIVEPLDKLYSGYLKAGAGMYFTPFFDLNYASKRSKYESWGVKSNFQSSLGSIREMGNTTYSDVLLGGYFQKFFLDHDLWAELDYERNRYQFYGLDTSLYSGVFEDTSTNFRQNYDLFDFHMKFNSKNTGRDTNKLRYKTWLDFHHLNSNYQFSENHFLLGGHSGWVILENEFLGTFELDVNNVNQPSLTLDTSTYQIQVGEGLNTQTSAILRLNPHIYTRKDNLIAKVGLSLQSDIVSEAKFYLFPDIEVSYSLFNDVFIPYAGWKGDVQRNTFNKIRLENPFISEDIDLYNTAQRSNLYAGIRGSLSSKFTFNFSTNVERFDNFYFYVPDTTSSLENKFQVTYNKVNRTTILGEVTYQNGEKLKLAGKAEYFIYKLKIEDGDEDAKAWQRPNFMLTGSAILDLSDKLIIRSDLYLVGSRNVYSYQIPTLSNNIVEEFVNNSHFDEISYNRYAFKLKPFMDMNLSAEYRYNDKVSAFIRFNNFTAKRYQFWTNTPVQSINIFGGLTLSF